MFSPSFYVGLLLNKYLKISIFNLPCFPPPQKESYKHKKKRQSPINKAQSLTRTRKEKKKNVGLEKPYSKGKGKAAGRRRADENKRPSKCHAHCSYTPRVVMRKWSPATPESPAQVNKIGKRSRLPAFPAPVSESPSHLNALALRRENVQFKKCLSSYLLE